MTLDVFVPADAPALCIVDHDPEHRRRFGFPEHFVPSVQHAEAVIARWAGERRTGTRFPFAVRDAASGELAGGCELNPVGEGTANLSYWTHPRRRRSGVATEAVRQILTLAFAELGFRRVEVVTEADNAASRRVALRNGFREAGRRDGRVLYVLQPRE